MTTALKELTLDFANFASQFEDILAEKGTWKGTLTTQTSQTLIELVATTGTHLAHRIVRASEDAFSEVAQSDEAIRSITQMQGLRMSRKLPTTVPATLKSVTPITFAPLTQFSVGSESYFNREQITLQANVDTPVTLYEGSIRGLVMSGLGSDRQSFMSEEDGFQVSDQDVVVLINNVAINKGYGGLWNYRNKPAYADLTTSDGRLLIVFGSSLFGSIPGINDTVIVRYAVTKGGLGNNQSLFGKPVSVAGLNGLTGTVTANPSGGSDEHDISVYKNLSSGAFGTYNSAVTKSQYEATVGVYPGIVDAFTQAQRDINPSELRWMNVVRVSGLTTSPWSNQQKQDFCKYMQSVSMYAVHFLWQDPIPVPRIVDIQVFCYNSAVLSEIKVRCEQAIQALFAPRHGLLMTNIYPSDLIDACMSAGNGAVSYVLVREPLGGMIVTAPPSPKLQFELVPGGTLGTYSYSYGIASVNAAGEEGPPTTWVFPQIVSDPASMSVRLFWEGLPDTSAYKIYGRRSGQIGLLGTVLATDPTVFVDDGTIIPTGAPPNSISQLPIRYNVLGELKLEVSYGERQQRLTNLPFRGGN